MNRREFLRLSSGAVAASYVSLSAHGRESPLVEKLRRGPVRIIPAVAGEGPANRVEITRARDGNFCRTKLINRGEQSIHIKEVVLGEAQHDLPDETRLYGESFQMLSQTGGTLGHPQDLGYSELKHYRIPQPQDVLAVSGMLSLLPPGRPSLVLGFTSVQRFIGRVFPAKGLISALLDTAALGP